ncbi:MAG: hypothetical protein M3010_02230 [Candidatus Dormibacteraeota bacterium]|nr:hypothetical protein [Candidatus Dormibacteraeota bacterium]
MCIGTMIPGTTLLSRANQGAGKTWVLDPGPPHLVECVRCQGRGLLENRRNRGERRQGSRDRRD